MPNKANLETQNSISRWILQRKRIQLTRPPLQPVISWYLIHRMSQDWIYIRIHFIRQIW